MQIHELNTFTGTPKGTDFIAVDSGFDTQKISVPNLLAPVKDEADKLKSEKINSPVDSGGNPDAGQAGQLLRSKGDGSTEWVDEGLPTDEQTAQAVRDWLDDHPEATTTVADGSLTEAKFTNGLKLATIKDYVTPQMYGAKGDSSNDDTAAFTAMLSSGAKNFLIPVGTYNIFSKLHIPNGSNFIGCGDGSILKRITTSSDYTDFLYIGGETNAGNFNIEIETGSNGNIFDGSIIKINEITLAQYNNAELRTELRNISALCKSNLGSPNEVAAIELSLSGTFGSGREGFCDISINNYSVRCASGVTMAYYCKAFATSSSYWITGVRINGGFVRNCIWGIFPKPSEATMFVDTAYSARFTAVVTALQMQAQTGTKGFVFLPYNKAVKIRLVGCIPWDFSSFSTYPYYFDYRRITQMQSVANDYLVTDLAGYTSFTGVETDYSLIPATASNFAWLLYRIGSGMSTPDFAAVIPKTYYIPHTAKAVKLYSRTQSSGRRTIIFRYLSASEGRTWATVTVSWIVGNAPTITIDGGTSSIKFGYILTQNGSSYTLDLYAVRSNSGSLTYLCFESVPFSNSQIGFDNSGQGSSYIATINMEEYPTSDVYLSAVPAGITYMETPFTSPLYIDGTDAGGNRKLYLIGVENGAIKLTETKYWYY